MYLGLMGWGIIQEDQEGWRKGPWTSEEDKLLIQYVNLHGEGRWNSVSSLSGLKRNGKSCRLRWVNYLRPDLKRGQITPHEETIIMDLHARWGNRWSTIARSLPGRTDNEIKNYWRTHFKKKLKVLSHTNEKAKARLPRRQQFLVQQQQQVWNSRVMAALLEESDRKPPSLTQTQLIRREDIAAVYPQYTNEQELNSNALMVPETGLSNQQDMLWNGYLWNLQDDIQASFFTQLSM